MKLSITFRQAAILERLLIEERQRVQMWDTKGDPQVDKLQQERFDQLDETQRAIQEAK